MDQPIDGIGKCARSGEELDSDEIAFVGFVRGADMPDARVGHRRLAVEQQADGLHGLDRERLMGLDECALMG